MPFYEYECNQCGHTLEAMQKISDSPLKKCPNCGKPQLQRLMSAPVFRLKGGGWYETDFKSDKDNKRNLADRPEAEASKEDKKETVEAGSKDTATPEAAKKPVDKPAEKTASAEAAKKPADGADSRRSTASGSSGFKARPPAQRSTTAQRPTPAQRPVRPAARRSAAKPARHR